MVTFTDLDRDDDGGGIAASASAPDANVAERLSRKEAGGLLIAALEELPQMYREIIELVIFQEKTYEDASLILGGISLGTLRSRMFHALRRLRSLLEKAGGATGDNLL
jgi:DNA-directed RNA polymerase specialized sigma24 family protein